MLKYRGETKNIAESRSLQGPTGAVVRNNPSWAEALHSK